MEKYLILNYIEQVILGILFKNNKKCMGIDDIRAKFTVETHEFKYKPDIDSLEEKGLVRCISCHYDGNVDRQYIFLSEIGLNIAKIIMSLGPDKIPSKHVGAPRLNITYNE